MTTERETVALGSCPACGGPAQFIAVPGTAVDYRHVALPNIDEDLGRGWQFRTLLHGKFGKTLGNWQAKAWRRRPAAGGGWAGLDIEHAFGDSPAAAYLALRTAIEARS